MNKILINIFFITATMAFVGCVREEDDIFDKSAVERLNAARSMYSDRLTAQGGSWVIELYPTNGFGFNKLESEVSMPTSQYDGVGYLVLAQFNADGTVRVGMNNALSNKTSYVVNHHYFTGGDNFNALTQYNEMTSNWDVNTDLGPVLSFSSYNDYLHIFTTPDEIDVTLKGQDKIIYKGNTGTGLGGDYEYVIVSLDKDATVGMLKGKKRGTYNRITRLPAGTDFDSYIKDIDAFKTQLFPNNAKNDLVLTLGSDTYRVRGISSYMPNVFPYNGNAVLSEDYHSYLITKRDGKYYLRFRSALGKEGHMEQEFVYDEAHGQFCGVTDPKHVIAGPSPLVFFDESLGEFNSSKQAVYSWRMTRTSVMSDSFKALFTAFQNDIKSLSGNTGSLSDVTITGDVNDPALLHVNVGYSYKNSQKKTVNATAKFTCAYSKSETGVTLSACKAVDSATENFQQSLSSVTPFLDALMGSKAVSAQNNSFNLNQLRLTSAESADMWYVLECR